MTSLKAMEGTLRCVFYFSNQRLIISNDLIYKSEIVNKIEANLETGETSLNQSSPWSLSYASRGRGVVTVVPTSMCC